MAYPLLYRTVLTVPTPDDAKIDSRDQAVIDSLKWFHYLEDKSATFISLCAALTAFLLNGRFGAAMRLVAEFESLLALNSEEYSSRTYQELRNVVQILMLLHDWRKQEDDIIRYA